MVSCTHQKPSTKYSQVFKGICLTKICWHPSFWTRRKQFFVTSIMLVILCTESFTGKELILKYATLLLSLRQKKRSCGLLVLLVHILTPKSLKRDKEPFYTTRGNAFAFVEVKNRGDCAHRCSSNWQRYQWRTKRFHVQLLQTTHPTVSRLSFGPVFQEFAEINFEQDIFYLRPKSFVPASDDEPWYECVAIGKNSLTSMLKWICQEAGIEEKTNHSLRATGTMSVFQANVSEQVVQKTTGHRPLQALQSYERVSADQHGEVMPAQPSAVTTDLVLNRQFYCECELHLFNSSRWDWIF